MNVIRVLEERSLQVKEEYKLPVFYFLLLGAFSSWQSFFNIHLDGIGMSSMQIGLLNAVFIFTSALVLPFWGILADKFGGNRVLLLLTTLCAVLVFLIGETREFYWMFVFVALVSIFHQPAGAVVDGLAVGFVKGNPRFTYGQLRLWSSLGYAVFSLIVGYLARMGTAIIFKVSAALFLLITLLNLITLPSRPVTGRMQVTLKSFGVFFGSRPMVLFLILILFFGIAVAPLMQFINLYYSDIGASEALIGWVFFVQAIPEIPAFFVGALLVKRIGAEKMILFSMGVSLLRMVVYGFISTPEIAILFSIFHCITIAFFLLGVVEYIQDRTPDHLRTTGQSLIWAFHFGAGVSLGNILLGYLRDLTGMLQAMHIHALLAFLILALTFLFFRYSRKDVL